MGPRRPGIEVVQSRALAHAIATDAANRVMRKAWPKREAWGDEESAVYIETFNRVWPLEAEYPWASPDQIAQMRRQLGYPEPAETDS
jgi:hypothetical protein